MFNLSPDHLPFDIECPDVESLRSAMQLCCEFEQDRYEQEMSAGEPINLSDLIVKVSPTETPFMRQYSATPHNVDQAMQDAVIYGTGMYTSSAAPHNPSNFNVASDPHLGPWPINGGIEPGQIMPGDKLPGSDDIFEPSALIYARNLAQSIYDKHFKASESPQVQWRPLDNLLGVLTQIDNLVSGLQTPGVNSLAANAEFPADWTALMELMTKHEWKPEHGPIVDVLSEWLDKFVQYAANFNEMEQKRYQAEHEVKVLNAKLQEAEGSNNIAAQQIHNLNDALQKTRGLIAQQQNLKSEEVESLRQSRAEWRTRYKNLRAQVKSAL